MRGAADWREILGLFFSKFGEFQGGQGRARQLGILGNSCFEGRGKSLKELLKAFWDPLGFLTGRGSLPLPHTPVGVRAFGANTSFTQGRARRRPE